MAAEISTVQQEAGQSREEYMAGLLHRITGIGVFAFLALHIIDIWLIGLGPEPFNSFKAFFHLPAARVFHLFLFFGLLFHAINGVRIILLDFWPAFSGFRRDSVYITLIICLLIFIPSSLLILMDAFLSAS